MNQAYIVEQIKAYLCQASIVNETCRHCKCIANVKRKLKQDYIYYLKFNDKNFYKTGEQTLKLRQMVTESKSKVKFKNHAILLIL